MVTFDILLMVALFLIPYSFICLLIGVVEWLYVETRGKNDTKTVEQ